MLLQARALIIDAAGAAAWRGNENHLWREVIQLQEIIEHSYSNVCKQHKMEAGVSYCNCVNTRTHSQIHTFTDVCRSQE